MLNAMKKRITGCVDSYKYKRLLAGLQKACIGSASVVKPYETFKGDAAINLEVFESRPGYPPYFHIGWVPGKWALGSVFGPQTREVDPELLRYAYDQAAAWHNTLAGAQLVQDLGKSGGNCPPGKCEEEVIRALVHGWAAVDRSPHAQ